LEILKNVAVKKKQLPFAKSLDDIIKTGTGRLTCNDVTHALYIRDSQ